MNGALRGLYRMLEPPGGNPLQDPHAALDAAVLNTYGFTSRSRDREGAVGTAC